MALQLSASILMVLLLIAFRKWAIKGEFLHPGFIFIFINGGLFLIFAWGPYRYNYSLPSSYYYMYALITCVFVAGTILGNFKGRKKSAKSISSLIQNKSYVWYLMLIGFYALSLLPLIAGGLNPEKIAENYENEVAAATDSFNIINFIIINITTSITQMGTAMLISHAFLKPKKYRNRIFIIILSSVFYAILSGSRTRLILFAIPIVVSIYITYKSKLNWQYSQQKINRIIVIMALVIIISIITITNFRSSSTSLPGYELLESVFHQIGIERKNWYNLIIERTPESISTTISLISIYAGSTIVHGGIVTNIVLAKGIFSWGMRNFFPIHRILGQLHLDLGFSELARDNIYKMHELGSKESFTMLSGWYGYPGNAIFDFGYIGSPIVAWITGYAIGWIYGRISKSGSILKSTGISVLTISLILTPAAGPFSFFSNFINFSLLGLHLIINSIPLKQSIQNPQAINIQSWKN